jgi:hypothetical protein
MLNDVEKLAGVGEGMIAYDDFLQEELEFLAANASIEGGYIILEGEVNHGQLQLADQVFYPGKDVCTCYKNMTHGAAFVCTAGKELTERVRFLNSKGDLIEAYIVDVLGSVIVEKAMDQIQKKLQQSMEGIGFSITNRYSPGYCEWNVAEQQKLFSFFPENFCNISLSESSLMNPVKSVSGIIGLGENVRFNQHVCHQCNSKNCLFRNRTPKSLKS